jgi:hypothetical protein
MGMLTSMEGDGGGAGALRGGGSGEMGGAIYWQRLLLGFLYWPSDPCQMAAVVENGVRWILIVRMACFGTFRGPEVPHPGSPEHGKAYRFS